MAKNTTSTKKENAKANATSAIVVRFNQDKGGIELDIPTGRRLTQSEKTELKELGFSWHRKNGYYYSRYTEDRMAAIKNSFLKEAKFPAAAQEKKVATQAEALEKERAAARAAKPKKETKASAQEKRIEELEASIKGLNDLMAKLIASQIH
jgi:hypothetical protein